jgi:hypothetical protein
MTEEEVPPLSQTDTEPAPLRLQRDILPHAGDASCMIIPSRSLTSSLRTPSIERSRTNSVNDNESEEIINSSANDLNIL